MPVKIAAVRATPSERTPITSISWITRRKYFGGSAALRITCAVSSPTPPYHIAVRLRYVSIAHSIAKLCTNRRNSARPPSNSSAGAT